VSEPTQTAALPLPTNKRFIDLTGQVFGDLTVLSYQGRTHAASIWECRCVCGKIKRLKGNNLRRGCTRSCGCIRTRNMGDLSETAVGRVCVVCGLWKSAVEFGTQVARSVRGTKRMVLRPRCKKCAASAAQQWRSTWSPERRRKESHRSGLYRLADRLGVTVASLQEFLDTQGGVCQICGTTPTPPRHRLSIDHDHQTGELRGALCPSCNLGLGSFGDDPRLLRRAAEYLEKFQRERH